jgi:hypothetical protein
VAKPLKKTCKRAKLVTSTAQAHATIESTSKNWEVYAGHNGNDFLESSVVVGPTGYSNHWANGYFRHPSSRTKGISSIIPLQKVNATKTGDRANSMCRFQKLLFRSM